MSNKQKYTTSITALITPRMRADIEEVCKREVLDYSDLIRLGIKLALKQFERRGEKNEY